MPHEFRLRPDVKTQGILLGRDVMYMGQPVTAMSQSELIAVIGFLMRDLRKAEVNRPTGAEMARRFLDDCG